MRLVLIIFTVTFLCACHSAKQRQRLTLSDFNKRAKLMTGVVDKLFQEEDTVKLKEIAVKTQYARLVNCDDDITKECEIYNDILSKIVSSLKDNVFSAKEKKKVRELIADLRFEISRGRETLKQ